MTVDDSYRELGLAPGCSDADLKAAWRRMSARWHPDRNASPQALRKIQRINRALEAIRQARAGGEEDAAAEEDAPATAAAEHTVSISLEEVLCGCSRELRGEVQEQCADCQGSGLQPQAAPCSECGGSGQLRPHLWFSLFTPLVACSACQGQGSTRHGCTSCAASGQAPARRYRCRVEVPAGARHGDVFDVDVDVHGRQRRHQLVLRLRVELAPHPLFVADADGTVRCEVPVDGFAWMAEGWIDVPTPDGLQQMRLRRGSLAYRIRGAGLPWQDDGTPADCIVTIVPLFPQELSRQQEALVDKLVASNSGAPGTAAGERAAQWQQRLAAWQGQ